MKSISIRFFFTILLVLAALIAIDSNAQELPYPPAKPAWNADSLGNHRAVLKVSGNAAIAEGKIYWRRKDEHPEDKQLILVDATTDKPLNKLYCPIINRAYADIYFQPVAGHSTYYLYYMPYRFRGSPNYPKAYYPEPENNADNNWIAKIKQTKQFASANLVSLQAVDSFNSFYPMEMIATAEETQRLVQQHAGAGYLVFPEDRLHPIKMKRDLPARWVNSGVKSSFAGEAKKGENYAFQFGVYPINKTLKNVQVHFTALKNNNGAIIPDSLITCINTDGISYAGTPVKFTVDVPERNVQALWCYLKVPENITAGTYDGTATITANNAKATNINIKLTISQQTANAHGVNAPWKMTRLPWLNSTLAQENTVITPYQALTVQGDNINLLGRKLMLSPSGLPAQIQTFFPIEMTSITDQANDLFTKPVQLNVVGADGKALAFSHSGITYTKKQAGTIEWQAINTSGPLKMEVNGHIEFDGFVAYEVKIIASHKIALQDINLDLPMQKKMAKYFMGLGYKGEARPENIDWKWDVAHKNQEGGWIGNVNGGIQFALRDQHYSRPLNTNFYLLKPLILPESWGNGDKGGIRIGEKDNTVLVNGYSGAREMQAGDTLYYNFNLLVTPFHPINTDWQWTHRFYHAYQPVDTARAWGANVINIHQGNFINPYINYPFIAWKQMKAYIDSAHEMGMKVKIYNTIRELADRAYELYPMRSLGHKIFSAGKGGGYPWLQEHLDSDYIAGWYTPPTNDAAIVNGGMSRWHNYYVEGMNWLVKNVGIDGLYLDDVAYDRITMKRVKRELLQDGHPGIIDLHSANQYDKADGWNNSANLYMELFPYINKLWFGEYFDYEKNSPDFFLTEVSGIPFGLMGEMLQDGGNPWRGMIYGMTNRAPWTKSSDPRPIWKAWKDFGITGSRMIGYWVPDNPVKTDNPRVLATVYKKDGKAMVSIASWADADTQIHLKIDWKALGINPENATITAPAIRSFQESASFKKGDAIPVAKNKGWLLIIK